MGFRFRKSIRILPGIRLNLSKSGVSTSIGGRGATINVGKRGVRGTVGLPGTGLSYSEMLTRSGRDSSARDTSDWASDAPTRSGRAKPLLAVLGVVAVGVVVLLFVAGLMSARQTGSTGTFEPRPAAGAPAASSPAVASVARGAHVDDVTNCRANPTTRAKVVAKLTTDDQIEIVGEQNGWTRVTSGDQDCWVSSSMLQR